MIREIVSRNSRLLMLTREDGLTQIGSWSSVAPVIGAATCEFLFVPGIWLYQNPIYIDGRGVGFTEQEKVERTPGNGRFLPHPQTPVAAVLTLNGHVLIPFSYALLFHEEWRGDRLKIVLHAPGGWRTYSRPDDRIMRGYEEHAP